MQVKFTILGEPKGKGRPVFLQTEIQQKDRYCNYSEGHSEL